MECISADEIAVELAPATLDEVRLQAGRLCFERINDRIERGASSLPETTSAGKVFHRFLLRLSQANYTVIPVFACLEPAELRLARVRQRVRKGGHAIPESGVLRRFDCSLENSWHQCRLAVTRWHLVQNSGTSFEKVAIGHVGRVLIKDNDQYEVFLRAIGEPGNE